MWCTLPHIFFMQRKKMIITYELSDFPLVTKQSTTIAAIVRSVDTNPNTQAVIVTFSDGTGYLGSPSQLRMITRRRFARW